MERARAIDGEIPRQAAEDPINKAEDFKKLLRDVFIARRPYAWYITLAFLLWCKYKGHLPDPETLLKIPQGGTGSTDIRDTCRVVLVNTRGSGDKWEFILNEVADHAAGMFHTSSFRSA